MKMNMTNNTTLDDHPGACDGAHVMAMVGWTVFATGVVSNLLLLYFVLRKLTKGKRNDKLFLMNIVAANLLALFGSFLGELLSRGKTLPSIQGFCIFLHLVNFVSLFTNITSMAALCYDRFENVTKFPGQRKLSFGKSMKVILIGWALTLLLIPITQSGFIITDIQDEGICEVNNSKRSTSGLEIFSFFALVLLVSVWITFNSLVIRKSLQAINIKLKTHRQETENVLGRAKTAKEVNLNKQAVAMVTCYSVCWIPFGIAAGLTALNIVSLQSCFYFGCLIGAHASAACTPLVYLTIDKRFRL